MYFLGKYIYILQQIWYYFLVEFCNIIFILKTFVFQKQLNWTNISFYI